MTKKEKFIEFFKDVTANMDLSVEFPEVLDYFNTLCIEKEKPLFTDNGKVVLGFLQTADSEEKYSAKIIAENLGLSAKTVSGSMRKLVTDGFIEKVGTDPCLYTITEKGKNIIIE